jgi:hypothetical protein
LSQSELNKLQAKVLKARLMGSEEADELEKEYEAERVRATEISSLGIGGAGVDSGQGEIRMLPTLDGFGRLYDVGSGGKEEKEDDRQGRKRKKEKV